MAHHECHRRTELTISCHETSCNLASASVISYHFANASLMIVMSRQIQGAIMGRGGRKRGFSQIASQQDAGSNAHWVWDSQT